MSFWSTSTGEDIRKDASDSFVLGGPIELIPAGTNALAYIDEAKWATNQESGRSYVELRWSVLKPEALLNRKVYQKLWVNDHDPTSKDGAKKTDKAKRMLGAIDFNAGGKLLSSDMMPTDEAMTIHLTNKPMVVRIEIWEQQDQRTGGIVSGNWIAAVAAKTSTITKPEELTASLEKMAKQPRPAAQTGSAGRGQLGDEEIPF